MSPSNTDIHPSHFNLENLIQSIHRVLGDGGLDSNAVNKHKIIQLMELYSSNSADWNKYTLFDKSRPYTRNLIDDGNGKFNLILLAWNRGQKSPIHDHSGSHCVMKVLDGQLNETLYEYPTSTVCDKNKPLTVTKNTVYNPNEVTYVHDNIGLHRISNPNPDYDAVSLHLYTPPYQMCKTFEENTGKARSSGICTFYSVGGHITL